MKTNRIFVTEFAGRLIGAVIVSHNYRKGWINRLAVRPNFRNKGIAKELVKYSEKWLRNEGIQIIACLIENWNNISMELFQDLEYEKHNDIKYFTKRDGPQI